MADGTEPPPLTACADCQRPAAHALCDACIARVYRTPVEGEDLSWTRERLLRELTDAATSGDRPKLALSVLHLTIDDGTSFSHTTVCHAVPMRSLLRWARRALATIADEPNLSPEATLVFLAEIEDCALLTIQLARSLAREARKRTPAAATARVHGSSENPSEPRS